MPRLQSFAWTYRHRWEVPLLLLLSTGLLAMGLSIPVLETKALILWKDEYSIWAGIVNLYREEHYILAAIILLFSIVFPVVKLTALSALWILPFSVNSRRKLLFRIKVLGKWSMLDVFVVAVIVVITQAGGLIDAKPRAGLYIFASAILLSMLVTFIIDRLVSHAR